MKLEFGLSLKSKPRIEVDENRNKYTCCSSSRLQGIQHSEPVSVLHCSSLGFFSLAVFMLHSDAFPYVAPCRSRVDQQCIDS